MVVNVLHYKNQKDETEPTKTQTYDFDTLTDARKFARKMIKMCSDKDIIEICYVVARSKRLYVETYSKEYYNPKDWF